MLGGVFGVLHVGGALVHIGASLGFGGLNV